MNSVAEENMSIRTKVRTAPDHPAIGIRACSIRPSPAGRFYESRGERGGKKRMKYVQ